MSDVHCPKPLDDRCLECGAKAVWLRCTQFAGDHPYCDEHARQEPDFNADGGSYFSWCDMRNDDARS